jgi:L-serine/L-threonine ammonia-lyase
MNALHIETPFFTSSVLTQKLGRPVWLKLEALQPPGSFKIRGVGLACQEYARRGAQRFVSSSGGNAGIAVAYAGRHLGLPVVVVVPETTTTTAKRLIQRESAEVIVQGASWQEANQFALSMLSPTDAFLHPFDDPLLWQGHSTLIDEVARTGIKPDAIVLAVGGGGLLCGIVEGLHRHEWQEVPVIAVETAGADSFRRSLAAGHRVELDAITSLASSLGAKQVCEQAFSYAQHHPIHSVVVSDRSALSACRDFLEDHRLLVEPACGAALAVAYERLPVLQELTSVLMIVCGGATMTVAQLQRWLEASNDP